MDYVAIDFEASCLPRHGRSFPIEVGISGREGTRSWLIRPHAGWHGWDWTDEAFRLHGIGRDTLEREGASPRTVMAELTEAIADRRVIADSLIDANWWNVLAAVSGGPLSPVEHASLFLDELGPTAGEIAIARHHADRLCAGRHRAGADAAWLWSLLSALERSVAARTSFRRAA